MILFSEEKLSFSGKKTNSKPCICKASVAQRRVTQGLTVGLISSKNIEMGIEWFMVNMISLLLQNWAAGSSIRDAKAVIPLFLDKHREPENLEWTVFG